MPKTLEGTRRTFHKEDVLLEHIASTYFSKKARPKTRPKKRLPTVKDVTLIFAAAGTITAAVILLLVVASITGTNYNEFLRKKVSALKVIPVIDKGLVNQDIVKRFELSGYARKGSSKIIKDAVILKNPRKYNWADMVLPFRFPVDLSDRTLNFSVRGGKGGEKITILLKDTSNRSIRLKELYLSSEWRDESILLSSSGRFIDISKINSLRVEYGRLGESAAEKDSSFESTIYLRDMNLSKETISL